MNIQTDHVIEAGRPDMVVIDKAKNHCQIIDFTVPYDSRVEQKELEKKEKYHDLARELKKIWNMKATVTPVVNTLHSAFIPNIGFWGYFYITNSKPYEIFRTKKDSYGLW